MILTELKELLMETGDLRLLEKENGEVRVTDLFLNGDTQIRLEQYSTINKSELERFADGKEINGDCVDDLLSCVKLWCLFAEETDTPFDFRIKELEELFDDYDIDTIKKLPEMNFNETVISFMDSNLDKLLFRGTCN